MKTGQSMVMGIASLDTGVFGGILVGLLVAKLHNKYYNIQLPPVLGIFSGTKFVPMISLLACSALGLVMSVVWPFVQTGLGFMGEIIYDTGMAGSVIYGLAERALLPLACITLFTLRSSSQTLAVPWSLMARCMKAQ